MKALDEIVVGFLIFFIIERGVRLVSSARYGEPKDTKIIGFEFTALVTTLLVVMYFRRYIQAVNI
jgi:hypothetical protein